MNATIAQTEPTYMKRPNGESVAFRRQAGAGPGLLWLGGFGSDMLGSKAQALAGWAAEAGRAYVRFDYQGHGESSGAFDEGTIGLWRDDALAVLDAETQGPQILVGSSMGGWIALLAALARPERVAGLVLIAPAPDFTEELMWAQMSEDQRRALLETGRHQLPGYDGAPGLIVTRRLIEEGRAHLILGGRIDVRCPIRILQGMRDEDVPFAHALKIVDRCASEDIEVSLVKRGDHRLSGPEDLERLTRAISALGSALGAAAPA